MEKREYQDEKAAHVDREISGRILKSLIDSE